MATLQSRLQKLSQKHGTARPTSVQSRLQRLSRLHGTREEEEEEEKEESFIDELVGLGERVWYGETEDPWFGRTDAKGRRQAPLMGEVRGKMGLEDIAPYAAQFMESPYEKGVKPLAKLGYGLSKMGPFPTSDPNVVDAQRVVSEGAKSITGLARNPLAKDYYPVEGVMNVAALAAPGLKTLGLPKAARVASVVADPISPSIGLGAKAVKRGVEKATPFVKKGAEKAVGATAKPRKAASQFAKDVKIPGRALRMEFTQAAQAFFTDMKPEFVDRMHQYATDLNLSQRMHDARLSPKPTMDKVQAKIKAYVDKRQEAATKSFGDAKAAAVDKYGAVGVSTGIDGALPATINDKLTGFGGRLMVRWKEKMPKRDPITNKVVEVEVARSAEMNKEGVLVDKSGTQINRIPGDVFEWDVKWLREEATMGDKANKKVQAHLREMLNSGEVSGETGGRSLSVQQGLTYVEKNNAVIAGMKRGQRPAAKLTSGIREIELAAIDAQLPKDARGYFKEYRRHKEMLDQLEEDFGVRPYMDKVSRKKLRRKLQGAFTDDEATDNVTRLETIIGKEGVADIIGSAHFGAFGGGLVVRSEFSNIAKLIASIPVVAVGAGAVGLGPVAAIAGGLIATIPLAAMISPRAMLEVSRVLGRNPKWRKAITGRGDVKIQPEALQALITNVRQMAQKLKAQNIDVKTLAAQGMTLGQLMQRLEPE